MATNDADVQILYGLLAYRMKFLTVAEVSHALSLWASHRSAPLGQVAEEQGMLDQAAAGLVGAVAERHLALHRGDPRRCLDSFDDGVALLAFRAAVNGSGGSGDGDFETPRGRGSLTGVYPGLAATVCDGEGPRAQVEPVTTIDPMPRHEVSRTVSLGGGSVESGAASYEILRPLARGGVGEVFVAHDASLNREVALKMVRNDVASNPDSISRFLLEAEITGGLEHPGIAPVYALGRTADGRPFYAMRLIRGETLKEAIRRFHDAGSIRARPLEFRKLLDHFVRVCDIVAYAHSRAVLHRDLKPMNVMIGKYGETIVVDWGLAKASGRPDAALLPEHDEPMLRPLSGSREQVTRHGSTLGTPQFISPEQALGQLERVGPASDVYGLGATLYSLLTGQPPVDGSADELAEMLARVVQGQIPPARRVRPAVPATLESVCRKAMALRLEDRYASPRALADDIEHWLADEPVRGVAEPWGRRLSRWERRHRTLIRVGGLALAAVALVSIASALGVNAARTRAEERRLQAVALSHAADAQKAEANRHRDASDRLSTRLILDRGLSLLDGGDRRGGLLWLARALPGAVGKDAPIERVIRHDLAAWGRSVHRLRDCLEHSAAVRVVAWSPTGRCVATASDDGQVRLHDPATGAPIGAPMQHQGRVSALAFSPDGTALASAGDDRTARLWNATSTLPLGAPLAHLGSVTCLAFTPDGKTLVTGSTDGTVRRWDVATARPAGPPLETGKPVRAVALSRDGATIASGGDHGTLLLWDARTGQVRHRIEGLKAAVGCLAISPDGAWLAAHDDNLVKLWRIASGLLVATSIQQSHTEGVLALAFSPDGRKLASGSRDTSCRIWCVPGLVRLGPRLEQHGHVWAVAFSPDGTRLASAADDNTVQLWDAATNAKVGDPLPHPAPVHALAFSGDGRSLLTGCDDGAGRLWELGRDASASRPLKHGSVVRTVAARPDGKALATVTDDGQLWLWDAVTTRLIARRECHKPGSQRKVLFDCTGRVLLTCASDATVGLWDGTTLAPMAPPIVMRIWARCLAVSPDGATFAAGDQSGQFGVYDLRTGRPVAPLVQLSASVVALAYSPDGTRLVATLANGEGRIWDVTRMEPVGVPLRHTLSIHTAVFSPDGTRIATGSYDKTARLWDGRTGLPIGAPMQHRGYVWDAEFSPDGTRLLTASFDTTAQFWNARTGLATGEPMQDSDMLRGALFNDDASVVLTFGRSGVARFWDAATARPLGAPMSHPDEIDEALFLPGRPVAATTCRDGNVRLWEIPTPLTGPADRIAEQMVVLTGMELGPDDVVRVLDVTTWKTRRDALERAGGAGATGGPAQ